MRNKQDSFIILTPGFPRDEAEDQCLPLQQLIVKQIKAMYPGLRVHVLSFQYPFRKDEYEWKGCRVKAFAGKNRGGFRKRILRYRILHYLRHLHAAENIKGLLSFWLGECAATGKIFAEKNRLRHRCWLMGQDVRPGNPYVQPYSFTAGELIALSDSLQEELEKNYNIPSVPVIYPAVEESLFEPEIPFRDIDVIAAGSFIPLKQFHLLLPMIRQWKIQLPGMRVVMVGKGPEEQSLKKMVKEAGLSTQVKFTGEVPHAELIQLMQRSKVLVHPSSYEGFSGVCMEALRAGCRVVSFTKAQKSAIQNWTVAVDPQAMEQEVLTLLQKPLRSEPVRINSADEMIRSLMTLFNL